MRSALRQIFIEYSLCARHYVKCDKKLIHELDMTDGTHARARARARTHTLSLSLSPRSVVVRESDFQNYDE